MFWAISFRPRAIGIIAALLCCVRPAIAAGVDASIIGELAALDPGSMFPGALWPDHAWSVVIAALVVVSFLLSLLVVAAGSMQRLRERYRRRARLISTALNHIQQGVLMADGADRVVFFNDRYLEIYGLSRPEFHVGMPLADMLRQRKAAGSFDGDPTSYVFAKELHNFQRETPNGRCVSVSRRRLPNGGWISTHDDVTDRRLLSRELEQAKKFLEQIVDNIPIALTVKRARTREYLLVNRSAELFMDRPRESVIGRTSDDIFEAAWAELVDKRDDVALSAGHAVSQEVAVKTETGSRLLLCRRVAIEDNSGEGQYLIQTSEDITERRQIESRMAHMAFYDTLTNIPNRSAFIQTLTQMIEACGGSSDEFSVLSLNLDRFKEINDVFGPSRGDKLLVEVSKRLQWACEGAVIARLSGDEFGVIIDGPQPRAGCDLAENLAQSLRDEFVIDGRAMRIAFTAGIAIYPRHGKDAASLLSNAAAALFRAKTEARGSALVFEAKMDSQTRERRAMQQELAKAISNGELCLHYQPEAITGRARPGAGKAAARRDILGFEALARWNHPVRGLISPALFIPIAEESGLISELGEWVLREACREAATWKEPLLIAVNISPAQFLQGDIAVLVHSILMETGLAPGRLELEITEGVLIRDFERGLSLLRRLKALGVRIAMDDFGTGYSSLSYLQSFPLDKIKIDRAFTTKIGTNPQSGSIIRAVIGLGHGLDIPIVAEGVETREQLEFLAAEDCDQVQGFFIGRPRPIADYADIVGRADAVTAEPVPPASRSETLPDGTRKTG